MLQQMATNRHMIGKYYSPVGAAILTGPFPFPDRDDQPSFSVRRNGP